MSMCGQVQQSVIILTQQQILSHNKSVMFSVREILSTFGSNDQNYKEVCFCLICTAVSFTVYTTWTD